jgi:phage terminase large subunit
VLSQSGVPVARSRGGRPRGAAVPFDDVFGSLEWLFEDILREHAETSAEAGRIRWPSPKYRHDPVGFAREVLGVEPWAKQVEILEAVRDHKRVAVRSGHKVSKSHTAAILALWFYCSFDDARVVMTCVTARQVDEILWRETKKLHARALLPIDGEPKDLARSGLDGEGFRQIRGFTAKESEAVAGISGANILYLPDEASGIPDAIFEAIEGNRAGGARLAMFSNPTQTEGEFFEAFESKKDFYKTIHVSSEESPNVLAGREVIPGLAGREWVEEKKREWGVDSALYQVRVRGNFVRHDTKRIFSLHLIGEAEKRWHETSAVGRLFIGLDPAGSGAGGDESAFAVRRGQKVEELVAMRALTPAAHLVHLLGLIGKHRSKREQPAVVVLDATGDVGTKVRDEFRAHVARSPADFVLVEVDVSRYAYREPLVYKYVRDEVLENLRRWMADGGAIPEDAKLAKELHAPLFDKAGSYGPDYNRLKATHKDKLRQQLGRSPDRLDAVALSVWEANIAPENDGGRPRDRRDAAHDAANDDAHSPYDAPAMTPYGCAA